MTVAILRSLALAAVGALVLVPGSAPLLAAGDTPRVADWTRFDGGPRTSCADGSAVPFMQRISDPSRVVLYLEGGGACFSTETCAFHGDETSYISSIDLQPDWMAERDGIFDADDPQNPLATHSFVDVPYCTGDVHLGTATTAYSDELTVRHWGYWNVRAALDHLVETFPGISQLVVAGVSAGSVATPFYAALAADVLPDARIVTLADGSGAFPSDPALNAFIGNRWGVGDALPDWPETEALAIADWGVPDLYRHAGKHAPDVTFARFDYAFDATQSFYARLAGFAADEVVRLIDQHEAQIEADGVDLASYTAPGEEHTILWREELYELEVEGVRFVDWLRELVDGGIPEDVHCVDCD